MGQRSWGIEKEEGESGTKIVGIEKEGESGTKIMGNRKQNRSVKVS